MVRILFIAIEIIAIEARCDDFDFNSSHDNVQVGVETNS